MDGTPFGRYRLIELLGRGGMGEVWRAYDPTMDRVVALKVLPQNFAGDQVFKERFRREARAAAGLDEPHVVPFYDFGEVDGQLYVTMRLINGRDLQSTLANGPLAPERAVRIIEQVAKALHAAHRIGLIHRDVKPSNILIAEDDFAYLIDFGIARAAGETGLTSTGAAVGTWAYMSPERLNTGHADARADIYALTCVLHEALTGQRPYPGDSLEQQIVGHLTSPPPRPSMLRPGVPQPMDAVIAKGMAKQPDQRYASTVELARAARDATTVPLPRPAPAVPVHPSSRPDLAAAGPIKLSATGAAPVWQPPPGSPPPWVQPSRTRPMWRRPGIVIPALLAAIVLLIGGGVFAAVKVSQGHENAPTASAPPPTAAPNTGPFTGTFTADFGPDLDFAGKPIGRAPRAYKDTWRLRSVCQASGCVATALPGARFPAKDLVFDDVGGRWLAVVASTQKCANLNGEEFEVISLQPRPDGTISGEWTESDSKGCYVTRTVTFTRTADTDVSLLIDPASQPPRVVSPAEALHGRYHYEVQYANGDQEASDLGVRTDCLRTGERCMSFFHGPDSAMPLVFGGGKWSLDQEADGPCSSTTAHMKFTGVYPLPQPPQNPITLLTGHGHVDVTGTCPSSDFDSKFARTGD